MAPSETKAFLQEEQHIDSVHQANGVTKPVAAAGGRTGEQVWDTKTQQYHAGQDWTVLEKFIEDYSVTTNALGTPWKAKEAAKRAIDRCDHYPPANQEPGKSSLAKFIWPEAYQQYVGHLLLGNGASELIDLITHLAPRGTWKPGPFPTQYKEYERSAKNYNYKLLAPDSPEKANIICLVNPCNPTGDYLTISEVKQWIESNVLPGGFVLVDESMQPWHSPDFRKDSLISQRSYIEDLYKTTGISVFVIHSWTKLWSCCGLRLGSVICPTAEDHAQKLKSIQVPWSVNMSALAFLDSAANDMEYLEETWKITPLWRQHTVDKIKEMFPSWECHGRDFTSWIWVDTNSAEVAKEAVRLSQSVGMPVRSGTPGYQHHTYIRVAVRNPDLLPTLLNAWKPLLNFNN
ncbi:hypothetical protein H4219_004614 [Mycoemilia scoparia]|uniref:Aminotransferase class I/classII large domain-containing protein n=1 Tax=Mycoemilia scoparia TaxID=417184 RepID=A0A9W8DMJ9_9FUNG|nr:hypothetical protein H4219_004614 [Mycoemilia scoparia]